MPSFAVRLLCVAVASALACAAFCMVGCSRTQYRAAADSEAYHLVSSRQTDPRWEVPNRAVEPRSDSRMYLATEDDCGPKPADDPAAQRYMDCPEGPRNSRYYDRIGTRAHTENPIWLEHLPRGDDGKIQLDQPLAVDLALLHSRDYQTQFESVYLSALNLSGNRFEFDCQWFGGLGTNFTATGEDLGDIRLLEVSDRLGFGRNLAGGGQFATSILNSLFWDFGTGGIDGGSASVVSTFTQPILRGAFRHVRLENLTQAERDLLYSVRDFARFRRLFYLDVTTNYLTLLTLVQAIRNTRTNVDNLRQSLAEYEVNLQLGTISSVERDQVYQDYQNGRRSLLSTEQAFIAQLDQFKFDLGLPSWIPFNLDESLLEPFELVDADLIRHQEDAQQNYEALVQYLPPQPAPRSLMQQSVQQFRESREMIAARLPTLRADLARWQATLDVNKQRVLTADDELDIQQQESLANRVDESLTALATKLETRNDDYARLERLVEQVNGTGSLELPSPEGVPVPVPDDSSSRTQRSSLIEAEEDQRPAIVAWRELLQAIGQDLREELAEVYIAQTQIRLFLIELEPLNVQQQTAITFAHQNRLDLMNTQARVMDSFRRVEVAADALQSDLNLRGEVALGSDPSKNNAFRLDSSANTYRVGVQFDGPLNRLNERNQYRATQLLYQRSTRDLLAGKDRIANEVREILRQLQLRKLNFQIARQQLVAASRQVERAQIDLRKPEADAADANLTIFLLSALQQLLDAKNNLISEWVRYRVEKIRLFTALGMLYLDETGHWINETEGLEMLSQERVIDPEYFPPQWVPANETPTIEDYAPGVEELPVPVELPPAPVPLSTIPTPPPLLDAAGIDRRSLKNVRSADAEHSPAQRLSGDVVRSPTSSSMPTLQPTVQTAARIATKHEHREGPPVQRHGGVVVPTVPISFGFDRPTKPLVPKAQRVE